MLEFIKLNKPVICHFSSVHTIDDTRVFHRECISLAAHFDVKLIAIGNENKVINGVQVIGIQSSKKKIFRVFSSGLKAFAAALQTNAVLYHIHDPEMIPFGILLSISGKHVIYDIHENSAGDIQYREWIPAYWRKLFVSIYTLMLKAANEYMHIIPVIADEELKEKLFLKEGNYTIIQNFASIKQLQAFRIENRFQNTEKDLIYAGLIQDHYYNIHPILEAIELLNQKNIFTKLHLIGTLGWGIIDEILNQHPKLEPGQVIFYGKLKPDEVFEISKKCKIGICLKNQSDELVFSHERKLFEYIGLGLPSIFCDKKIYVDLNKSNQIGIAVDLNSPAEISNAIFVLLHDEKLHKKIQKNCLKLSDSYLNWETEYLKLKNSYTNLISAI